MGKYIYRKQTVTYTASANAISQYLGKLRRAVDAQQSDRNGITNYLKYVIGSIHPIAAELMFVLDQGFNARADFLEECENAFSWAEEYVDMYQDITSIDITYSFKGSFNVTAKCYVWSPVTPVIEFFYSK